jgi:predicted ATPase
MIGEKRFLRSIQLRNLLSFGPDTPELELKSLNVLIGPNGSGKSNLIDAISLLQAAPRDLWEPVRTSGGIGEWIWKGSDTVPSIVTAMVESPTLGEPLLHSIYFTMVTQRPELFGEFIRKGDSEVFSRGPDGAGILTVRARDRREERRFELKDLVANQSLLSQRKDPQRYPELTFLGNE